MSFMEQRVEGIYHSMEEALQAVDRLKARGYDRKNLTIVANEEVQKEFPSNVDVEINTLENDRKQADSNDDDKSLWESVKDAFTTDDSDDNSNDDNVDSGQKDDRLSNYREAIRDGDLAVLITGAPNSDELADTTINSDAVDPDTPDPAPINPDSPGSDSINLDPGHPETPRPDRTNPDPLDTDITKDNKRDNR